MTKKFKWEVGQDVVNFYNYKVRIEKRLISETGRLCYLVSSCEEQDIVDEGELEPKWILFEEEIMCSDDDYEGQDCESVEELNDVDNAELGRLIAEGNTSGRLDNEDTYITWELKTLKWKDL